MKNAHMYTEQLAVAGCLSNKVFEQNCTEAFLYKDTFSIFINVYLSLIEYGCAVQ